MVGVAAATSFGGCKAVDDLQNHVSGVQITPRLAKMDPSSSSFVQRAPPPDNKAEPYFVAHGGAIYLVGGLDGSLKPVPGVQKYDPASNTYTKLADWPNPTVPDNFNELGTKLCALGGTLLDGTNSADLNCFDPDKNVWSKGAAIPSSAGNGSFRNVVYGGKLWTFESSKSDPVAPDAGADGGGIDASWDANGLSSAPPDGNSSFYAYDPATDAWTQKASSPYVCNVATGRTGAGGSGMVGVGSVLYVLGCIDGTYLEVGGPAFAYDTVKDTWTQMPSAPINVQFAFAMGNKILATSHESPFVAIYDTAASTWSTPKATPPPMLPFDWTAYGDATGLWYFDWADGTQPGALSWAGEAWRYDPTADTWTKTATLAQDVDASNRASFFPMEIGGDLYIAGAWVSAVISFH
jgi:hypothetical protein